MNDGPLISVLMTAYNREKYIGSAIESVLSSTYPNWELIITDDQSTDRTVEIANVYASQDERIKVFLNNMNLGDYANRNQAALHAKGKYIKYVDADDIIYPWGLEILVMCMEQFPDAGWGLSGLFQDKKAPFPFMLSPADAYMYHYNGPKLFHKAPLSSIIKRVVFVESGGFKNVRHYGDYELWHRLATQYPVVLMDSGITWWRSHENQEAKKRHQNALISIKTLNVALAYLYTPTCPLPHHIKRQAIWHFKKRQVKLLGKELLKGQFGKAYEMYRAMNNLVF